jgi:hypothetical protein
MAVKTSACLGLLLIVLGCSEARVCKVDGCGPGLGWLLDAPAPLALATARLELCHNESCVHSTGIPIGTIVRMMDEAGGRVEVFIRRYDASPAEISVEWFMSAEDAHDGDEYRITITGKDGTVLDEREITVSYEESYPNGPECRPLCRMAFVDSRAKRSD